MRASGRDRFEPDCENERRGNLRKAFDKWVQRSFLSKQTLSAWALEIMYVAYIAGVRRGKAKKKGEAGG